MATLRKLFFFFLALVILEAGGYARSNFEETLRRAQQGDANAQTNLGYIYRTGQGVPKDYKESLKWYRKATDQGHAEAQYDLGVMYYFGIGVPKDYLLSYMWLNLAASNATEKTRERAVELIDELEKKMTQEQIYEAQKLSSEWKSKGQNE